MRLQPHHVPLLIITWVLTLSPLPTHGFMNTIHNHRQLQNGRFDPITKEVIYLRVTTALNARTTRGIRRAQTLLPNGTTTATPSSEKFQLQLSNNNNNNNEENDVNDNPEEKELIDPLLILPLATTGAILGLILFVLYTKFTNPSTDFDIDFYMALDDMTTNTASGNGGGGGYYGNPDGVMAADTILGLPKLSPAEQLVGALFGPPSIP